MNNIFTIGEHQNFTFGDKSHLPLPSHFTFFMLVQHCWYYFGWKGEELSSLISWSPPHLEMDFTFFTFSFLRFFAFFSNIWARPHSPLTSVSVYFPYALSSQYEVRNEKAVLRQLSPSTFLYLLHRLKSLQKKVWIMFITQVRHMSKNIDKKISQGRKRI